MENNDLISFQIDRYNVIDYLKQIGKKYAPIPDHIINAISDHFKDDPQTLSAIGIYTMLYFKQNEFNNCELSTVEKCKLFFRMSDKPVKKLLDKLENGGFLVQKKEKHKKIIFVKYPEYIEQIKSITLTRETVTDTIQVDYENGKQTIATKQEKFIEGYIEWSNGQGKPIKNPAGFKRDYTKHPDKYDLSDYEKHLIDLEKQKEYREIQEEEMRKRRQEDIRVEKEREEHLRIMDYIAKLKETDPIFYEQLYNEALANAKKRLPDVDSILIEKNAKMFDLPDLIKEKGLI